MWAHVSVPPPRCPSAWPACRGGRRGAGQGDGEGTGRSLPDLHRLRPGPAPGARRAGGAGQPSGPEPGRPPTVVSGHATRTPGKPAGPRPHPATEISWPRARPQPGSFAAAGQGRPEVPGRPAAQTRGAASQQHAGGPAEPSAPPSGASPARAAPAAAPGPEPQPRPRPYEPPPAFRPREPGPRRTTLRPRSAPGRLRRVPDEPQASFHPREPSAGRRSGRAALRRALGSSHEPRLPSLRGSRPPSLPGRPPPPLRTRTRPLPAPARPRLVRTSPDQDAWLAPLRSFGGEPAGEGTSPPRQPPPYQPPRESATPAARPGAARPGRPRWCAAAGPGTQPAGTQSALAAPGRRGHWLRGRGRDRRRRGAGPGWRDQEPGRGQRQLSRRRDESCSRASGAFGSRAQHRCRRRHRPVRRPLGGR